MKYNILIWQWIKGKQEPKLVKRLYKASRAKLEKLRVEYPEWERYEIHSWPSK